MKSLILSDFHLGHAASKGPRYLTALARLAGGYDRVVINGDAVNACESEEERAEAEAILKPLREALAGREGGPVMVTGNHDPAISSTHHVYFEEAKLLAFHGDFILDNPAPWLRRGHAFAEYYRRNLAGAEAALDFEARARLFRKLQQECRIERYEIRECRGLLRYVAKQFLPPTRPFVIARYLWRAPGLAAELAAGLGRPVAYVAIGHTHRPGRWTRKGIEVLNTGSYMPVSAPFAVEIEGERVRHLPVRELAGRRSAPVPVPAAAREAPAKASVTADGA